MSAVGTPTPWSNCCEAVLGPNGEVVIPTIVHMSAEDRLKIVRSVNSRDELVGCLKEMTWLFRIALLGTTVEIARDAKPIIAKAEAAIAKAEVA